jgi:hypothetical protein
VAIRFDHWHRLLTALPLPSTRKQVAMTVPRLLLGLAVAIALYYLGASSERIRTSQVVRGARAARKHPEAKKDRARLQKLAKRNAKKITKGIYN